MHVATYRSTQLQSKAIQSSKMVCAYYGGHAIDCRGTNPEGYSTEGYCTHCLATAHNWLVVSLLPHSWNYTQCHGVR